MIRSGRKTLERYVGREWAGNGLMKIFWKVGSGEKIDFWKDKWCGPVPFSHSSLEFMQIHNERA